MKNGYSVRFYRINDLIALLDTKDQLQFQRFKESMRKIRLLCIDDYGTVLLNDNVVNRINEIVDCRYNSGATIITTQLKCKLSSSEISYSFFGRSVFYFEQII